MRPLPLLWATVIATTTHCGAREPVHLDGDAPVRDAASDDAAKDFIAPGVSIAIADQETAVEIAVDDERLYWRSRLPYGWGDLLPVSHSRVRSCLKSDCAATIVTYDSTGYVIGSGDTRVAELGSLTVANRQTYWTRVFNANVTVLSCPSSGCAGAPRVVLADADVLSMTADDTHLYWPSFLDTAILRLPLHDGARVQSIALNQNVTSKIVSTSTDVFWAIRDSSTFAAIRRAPKTGGTLASEVVVDPISAAFAVDSEFIYWAPSQGTGPISRCPQPGCVATPTVMIADQTRTAAIASDGIWLVWVSLFQRDHPLSPMGRVARCRIDDCVRTEETLSIQNFAYNGTSIAFDATHMYWVAQGKEDAQVSGLYPHATIYRHAK